jgi:hypothetical protein
MRTAFYYNNIYENKTNYSRTSKIITNFNANSQLLLTEALFELFVNSN